MPTPDGSAYILNGKKLWITNGTVAELMVVMARTPGKDGKPGPISAVRRRDELARVRGRAPPRVHGPARHRERRRSGSRTCACRRRTCSGARARASSSRSSRSTPGGSRCPRRCAALGKWCLNVCRHWANEPRAVGQARRQARRGRADARQDGRRHLRHGGRRRPRLPARRPRQERHPARGGDRQAVEHRRGLGARATTRCRSAAAAATRPRRAWPRAASRAGAARTRDARHAHQQASSRARTRSCGCSSRARRSTCTSRSAGDVVMPNVPVGRRLAGLVRAGLFYAGWYPSRWLGWGHWPQYGEFGAARRPHALGRAHVAPARAPDLPPHGAERSRARAAAVAAVPRRGRGRRAVRDGRRLLARPARHEARASAAARAMELADTFCRAARRRVESLFAGDRLERRRRTTDRARRARSRYEWLEEGVVPRRRAPPRRRRTAEPRRADGTVVPHACGGGSHDPPPRRASGAFAPVRVSTRRERTPAAGPPSVPGRRP